MKKYLISAIISTNVVFASGIPTVDIASIVQNLAQDIKEIAEWKEQADRWIDTTKHYSEQLTAYQNELASKTGVRDAVGFVKDLKRVQEYAQAYGDDYLDVAKAMANPSSNLGNLMRSLYAKYNIFDECKNELYKDWQKEACEGKLQREVQQIAYVETTKGLVDKSSENLDKLSKRISASNDIKESQDIANAINMEMAQMQVIQMRMDMMEKNNQAIAKAEDERLEKSYRERLYKKMKY